jgi:hypothetical protein
VVEALAALYEIWSSDIGMPARWPLSAQDGARIARSTGGDSREA